MPRVHARRRVGAVHHAIRSRPWMCSPAVRVGDRDVRPPLPQQAPREGGRPRARPGRRLPRHARRHAARFPRQSGRRRGDGGLQEHRQSRHRRRRAGQARAQEGCEEAQEEGGQDGVRPDQLRRGQQEVTNLPSGVQIPRSRLQRQSRGRVLRTSAVDVLVSRVGCDPRGGVRARAGVRDH